MSGAAGPGFCCRPCWRLARACRSSSRSGPRTSASLSVSLSSGGAREASAGRCREVPIRRELAQLLQLHMGVRRAGPLFASRQRGSGTAPYVYTRQRVGQIVREVARTAGVTKRVYPHLLRHTVATKLLALGMDITDVQRFLGHESLTTTRLYAETTAAVLRRKFDQITAPAAHALVATVQHRHGNEAALLAAELLMGHRVERLSPADA